MVPMRARTKLVPPTVALEVKFAPRKVPSRVSSMLKVARLVTSSVCPSE
ncbi:hypothetical protein ACN28I_13325 [Archangium gephyra]